MFNFSMRIFTAIVLTLTVWFSATACAQASFFSFSGDRPSNLGVNAGKFAACPATPNCVSSQATDAAHQIAPLAYKGDRTAALAKVKAAIVALPGSKIITESDDYIYAEFTSGLMGFVDDVEFSSQDGVIQVRSASRLGESDLGVNAKRVEAVRSAL
jgi:uncharacterized protein (DUF1499 family)